MGAGFHRLGDEAAVGEVEGAGGSDSGDTEAAQRRPNDLGAATHRRGHAVSGGEIFARHQALLAGQGALGKLKAQSHEAMDAGQIRTLAQAAAMVGEIALREQDHLRHPSVR